MSKPSQTALMEENKEVVNRIEAVTSKASSSEVAQKEPRMNSAKWLALFALGLSYMTAFQQGACTGAIVKSIDEALGPTTYYNWMLTGTTITSTLSLPLAGGLSDIFGRRWFMIIGGIISLIAAIIALCAQNVPTMIAAAAVAGLGSGSQQLALAAVAELVPNSMRGVVQACLDLLIFPWSVFGALTGGAMVQYNGKYGFRINYIVGVVLNSVSIIAAFLWYHPPSVGLRMGARSRLQAVKELDWIGLFLMNAGIIVLLVAIGIGGTTIPWSRAAAPIVIAFVMLAVFWLWEAKYAKQPFMDRDLFAGKARTFTMFLLVDFVAGMGLYAAAAFWAQLARGIWEADPVKVGILCVPGGVGGAVGGFAAGMLIGKHKFLGTHLCLIYGTAIKTVADYVLASLIQPSGPHSIPFGLGIAFLSMVGTGWTTVSLIVCVQLAVPDKDLGLATLLLGAVRAVGGSVAITIYSALLTNTLKKDAGQTVGAAIIPLLGSDASLLGEIGPLVIDLINENIPAAAALRISKQPGLLNVAREALKSVWTKGFHRVYLSAACFSAASLLAALISKDVSHNMTSHVATRLQNDRSALTTQEQVEKDRA